MESLPLGLSISPPFLNHSRTHDFKFKSIHSLKNYFYGCSSCSISSSHFCNSLRIKNFSPSPRSIISNNQFKKTSTTLLSNLSSRDLQKFRFYEVLLETHFSFLCMRFTFPLSSFASETNVGPEEISNKINLEAILISIDNFFNKYPFFVAGVTFVWLVVIPLTQEYLQKYKFTSALDAFRKLRDDPTAQLLDIREKKSLNYLNSPNLRLLNKSVLQVEYCEGEEEAFLRKVLESFRDPGNTIICVLDNFDGNSLNVAELLVKNGFKEAYAIRGGIMGKNGWQEIQETLLPPSVHIYPKMKAKVSQQVDTTGGLNQPNKDVKQTTSSIGPSIYVNEQNDNGALTKEIDLRSDRRFVPRSSSPYPNYPDLKPPSSPTPSKPKT